MISIMEPATTTYQGFPPLIKFSVPVISGLPYFVTASKQSDDVSGAKNTLIRLDIHQIPYTQSSLQAPSVNGA